MGEKAEGLGLVAFETLPWACRFNVWGNTATVLGTKEFRDTSKTSWICPNKNTKEIHTKHRMYVRIMYSVWTDGRMDGLMDVLKCMFVSMDGCMCA